jgi:hypothetical protein
MSSKGSFRNKQEFTEIERVYFIRSARNERKSIKNDAYGIYGCLASYSQR